MAHNQPAENVPLLGIDGDHSQTGSFHNDYDENRGEFRNSELTRRRQLSIVAILIALLGVIFILIYIAHCYQLYPFTRGETSLEEQQIYAIHQNNVNKANQPTTWFDKLQDKLNIWDSSNNTDESDTDVTSPDNNTNNHNPFQDPSRSSSSSSLSSQQATTRPNQRPGSIESPPSIPPSPSQDLKERAPYKLAFTISNSTTLMTAPASAIPLPHQDYDQGNNLKSYQERGPMSYKQPLSSQYPMGSFHQYSLLDDDPNFQEMGVYFPQMLLISSPYTVTLKDLDPDSLPPLIDSTTPQDNHEDLEVFDSFDGGDGRDEEKSGTGSRSSDRETVDSLNLTKGTKSAVPIPTTIPTTNTTTSESTVLFKFYPGATELPPVHLGLGFTWLPLAISGLTQNESKKLQHSIVHSVQDNGLDGLHLQFDGASIYHPDTGKGLSKADRHKNEAAVEEVDKTFRRVLYQTRQKDVIPMVTLHNFQSHRDDRQWNWLHKRVVSQFVAYATAVFPFFLEGGVGRIVTLSGWQEFCRRNYSSHKDILICQHHVLLAHIKTVQHLKKQCRSEQLLPIFGTDKKSASVTPEELLHDHHKHLKDIDHGNGDTKGLKKRLDKVCTQVKFTIGIQSAFYVSRARSGIAHIDYKRDYSTQTMTTIGRIEMSNPHRFDSCTSADNLGTVECGSSAIAASHANLMASGNTLNVLFHGRNSHTYETLINHSLDNLPLHKDDPASEGFKCPKFTRRERKHLLRHQPDFLFVEYITTKYVYYDESCLDRANHYSRRDGRKEGYDLNCLRYTEHDISGLPIGPHPAITPSQSSPKGKGMRVRDHALSPVHITRLVPRGISLLLQYTDDLVYLLRNPKQTIPLSAQLYRPSNTTTSWKNHHANERGSYGTKVNFPIVVTFSVAMAKHSEVYTPDLEVIVRTTHYDPKTLDYRARLGNDGGCSHDFFRLNALMLYLTEISMAMKQRKINVLAIIYSNFIDPLEYDPASNSGSTLGIAQVTKDFTIADKLSFLWFKSESTSPRYTNGLPHDTSWFSSKQQKSLADIRNNMTETAKDSPDDPTSNPPPAPSIPIQGAGIVIPATPIDDAPPTNLDHSPADIRQQHLQHQQLMEHDSNRDDKAPSAAKKDLKAPIGSKKADKTLVNPPQSPNGHQDDKTTKTDLTKNLHDDENRTPDKNLNLQAVDHHDEDHTQKNTNDQRADDETDSDLSLEEESTSSSNRKSHPKKHQDEDASSDDD